MRKIILSEFVSLDGYVSDKNGGLDFFSSLVRKTNAEPDQVKFLEGIDTILLGRKTYEVFARLWPERPVETEALADKINRSRKIVLSRTLTKAPWGKWPDAEIAGGDVLSTVKQLKSSSGKDIILWASISLAHALMKENLVDEYQLFVCPSFTGGGQRLFTGEISPATLKLVTVNHYDTGIVYLHYQHINHI